MPYRRVLPDRPLPAGRRVADGRPDAGRHVAAAAVSGGAVSWPFHAPTLAAQYIIKDIILVAARMVIAATWTGAKIVATPTPMLFRLRQKAPQVVHSSLALTLPQVQKIS